MRIKVFCSLLLLTGIALTAPALPTLAQVTWNPANASLIEKVGTQYGAEGVARLLVDPSSYINVRSAPGMNSAAIGHLRHFEPVYIQRKNGDWVLVVSKQDGTSGWVLAEYINVTKVFPAPPPSVDNPGGGGFGLTGDK